MYKRPDIDEKALLSDLRNFMLSEDDIKFIMNEEDGELVTFFLIHKIIKRIVDMQDAAHKSDQIRRAKRASRKK